MLRIVFLGAAVLALSTGAFAAGIDGNLSDWGVTPGSDWSNDVGASQWLEPEVGPNGYVGPGVGGQTFNVEAMYLRLDATYLYYAVVTGFPETSTSSGGTRYYPGDIFFDWQPLYVPANSGTPTGTMDFAIETTTWDSSDHAHGGKAINNQGAGSFYTDVTPALAAVALDGVRYPVEIDRDGSQRLANGTLVGQTEFIYTDSVYGSAHWVIEGRVPVSFFGDMTGKSGVMWWTMTCANDLGNLYLDVPFTSVPEPGTVLLTGSGVLFAIGYLLRRRMK